MRKYTLNEDFFENIDSEEKAYWLGFITADGCITDRHLIIALSRTDKDHLRKFLNAIEGTQNIIDKVGSKKTLESWVVVCSRKLIKDLNNLGITRAKSLTVEPWKASSEKLNLSYWRGLIDGDGSICPPYKIYNWWQVQLVGSKSTVEQFRVLAEEICGTTAKIHPKGVIWKFNLSGTKKCRMLIEKIYGDAKVALERKQLLANQLIGKPMALEGD